MKSRRGVWIALGCAIPLLLFGVFAAKQAPYPDPYRRPDIGSPDWWITPLEWNAPLRLPRIETHLRSVAVRETIGKSEVWVAGDGRFVARSSDEGLSWQQIAIPDRPVTSSPPGPTPNANANARPGTKKISDENSARQDQAESKGGNDSASNQAAKDESRGTSSDDPRGGWVLPPWNFYDVTTAGGDVWVVGDAGGIVHLGASEEVFTWQDTPVAHVLHAVRFDDDARSGVAVGDEGVILATSDGGKHWERLRWPMPTAPLEAKAEKQKSQNTSAAFGPSEISWLGLVRSNKGFLALGQAMVPRGGVIERVVGVIARIESRGTTKGQAQTLGFEAIPMPASPTPLTAAVNLDSPTAWGVGPDGVCLSTDGGATWVKQTGPEGRFVSTAASDPLHGWAVDEDMRVVETRDGGKTWGTVTSLVDTVGWLTYAQSELGVEAKSWIHWPLGAAITFDRSGRTGWIVGPDGFINRFDSKKSAWIPVTRYSPRGQGRWVNGVLTFDSVAFGVPVPRSTPFYHDWPESPHSRLNEVGLDRWSRPGLRYTRMPMPLFWLLLVVYVAAIIVGSLAWRPAPHVTRSEINPAIASDLPIGLGDPDPLRFGQVARGLSRFLRNENTEPPLTIAVTGEWGTGKSSLMTLLRDDLKRRGFRPVWFNAWHHQQEEHLLASLLATVRTEAIPTLSQPVAWSHFYARLLWRRGRRYSAMVLFLLFLFAVSLGHVWRDPASLSRAGMRLKGAADWVQSQAGTAVKDGKKGVGSEPIATLPPIPSVASPMSDLPPVATKDVIEQSPPYLLILSGLGLLIGLWKGATAFGLKPGEVLATMSKSVRVRDLTAQAGFRYQFGREFADVTWALRPRTLVLLVDDLDRCHPDHLMQVLETVNFLVSSGECVVVLGMAKPRVVRCIAHSFKELATGEATLATPGGDVPTDAAEAGRKALEEFARHYLEKIINVEVPVPMPTPDQARPLLLLENQPTPGLSPATNPEIATGRLTQTLSGVPAFISRLGLPIAAALAIVIGLAIGARSYSPSEDRAESRPSALAPAVSSALGVLPPNEPAPSVSSTGDRPAEVPLGEQRPKAPSAELIWEAKQATPLRAALKEPQSAGWELMSTLAWVVVLVAVATGLTAWMSGPAIVEKDSEEFVKALDVWYPVITARPFTPRALKRFLNRIRFVAARLHEPRDEPDRWEVFLRWLDGLVAHFRRGGATRPHSAEERSPVAGTDAAVVALSAIERYDPVRLTDDDRWRELRIEQPTAKKSAKKGAAQTAPPPTLGDALLAETLAAHREHFGQAWPPPDDLRLRFLEIEQLADR